MIFGGLSIVFTLFFGFEALLTLKISQNYGYWCIIWIPIDLGISSPLLSSPLLSSPLLSSPLLS
jgi:hypothetical protein